MPDTPSRVVRLTPRLRAVGSDLQDVQAIQAFLAPAQVQVSAAVDTCKAKLSQSVLDAWYALAKRIIAFVSKPAAATMLDEGRQLRDLLNSMMVLLKSLGCGDVAQLVHDAPPPKDGPRQSDATFLSALFGGDNPTTLVLVLAGLWWLSRGRR